MSDLVDELIDLLAEDADALNCNAELERLRLIAHDGTSCHRQRAVAEDGGTAAVVDHLIEEFEQDL